MMTTEPKPPASKPVLVFNKPTMMTSNPTPPATKSNLVVNRPTMMTNDSALPKHNLVVNQPTVMATEPRPSKNKPTITVKKPTLMIAEPDPPATASTAPATKPPAPAITPTPPATNAKLDINSGQTEMNLARPSTGKCVPPGQWACTTCTFLNRLSQATCAMCGNQRPAKAPVAPPRAASHANLPAKPNSANPNKSAMTAASVPTPTERPVPPDPPIAANIELPQAVRCLANCGFYGLIAKGRLCNKCYDDLQAQSKVRHNHLALMCVYADKSHVAYTVVFTYKSEFFRTMKRFDTCWTWPTSPRSKRSSSGVAVKKANENDKIMTVSRVYRSTLTDAFWSRLHAGQVPNGVQATVC